MARKINTANAEVEREDTLNLIVNAVRRLDEFEEGSAEHRAWTRYIGAMHKEAIAEAELDLIFDQVADLDIVPDKLQQQYDRLLDAHSRTVKGSLGAYMAFDHILKHTFTVPDKDAETIILDALKANQDAMPDEYMQLDGLARHREFANVAADLISELKSGHVKVHETNELEAPMCAECEEEIAA